MDDSQPLIGPEIVQQELESVLDIDADKFAHAYDIKTDRHRYRFDASGRTLAFSAYSEDLLLSIDEFFRKIIEPAAAEFRRHDQLEGR